MFEHILQAPISFWIAMVVLVVLTIEGLQKWDSPWAKPALVVYGTVGVWYLGDYALSNDREYGRFDPIVVERAYLQVSVFLLLLRFFVSQLVPRFCRGLSQTSEIRPIPQKVVSSILLIASIAWLGLFVTAVFLRDGEWLPLLWPPVRQVKLGMFVHSGVGSGGSFLMAAAGYIHALICALFGTIVVLGRGRNRWLAVVMVTISWPYFWFDRIRNAMLALLLPGVACYWIFGRQTMAKKALISLLLFCGVAFWFGRVMAYRGAGVTNLEIFTEVNTKAGTQYGLDMMKELCWINTFIDNGRYRVNWGRRYFAEVVNVVPRTFWPGKPLIGWDYAIARGQFHQETRRITATVATGMIGQGVVNFGPYLGIVAPAFLMSVWIALLARLWCQREHLPRMLLFLIGMGLTFNMGRDITLLVLFPFVFGYIGVRLLEYFQLRSLAGERTKPTSRSKQARAKG